MIAYVNTNKVHMEKIKIQEFLWQIEQPVWGDYSPADVLKHPDRKKYAENIARIKKADLSYPIFMTSKYVIIDGYHRFLKAIKEGDSTIKAYIFEPSLMRKFIINKDLDFPAVHERMAIHEVLEKYVRNFC